MRTLGVRNVRIVLVVTVVGMLNCSQNAMGSFIFGEPTMVPNINSGASEGSPQISRDGLELYFNSARRENATGCLDNIWVSRRATTRDSWSAPVQLDLSVNSNGPQFAPSVSADGLELYFSDSDHCIPNPGGYGLSDLWLSTRAGKEDPWGVPENLGPVVNTSDAEYTPCISADGLELYFMCNISNQPNNSEILVSTRTTKDDPWGTPANLGPNVNTTLYEYTPVISPDGLCLFFSRGVQKAHIYVSRRATKADPWGPAEFFAPVNSGTGSWTSNPGQSEFNLTFSNEDPTLYFTRGTSLYTLTTDYNIWQVEVIPVIDLNADGTVDVLDVLVLTEHWGPTTDPLYDIAPFPFGDGVVDAKDLLILAQHMVENVDDASDVGN